MLSSPDVLRPASSPYERSFGAVDLLSLVLEAVRPVLGFDLAVAVLCEDGRHVVPIYAAGKVTAAVHEGVHVQALAAFAELAGADHATWPGDEPGVIHLSGAADGQLAEPESYEDAPLVVSGAVIGMLRISCPRPVSKEQRAHYFAMASDVSKAIERLDAQRSQSRLVQERLLQSEKMSSVGQLVSGVAHELNNPLTGIMGFAQLLLLRKDIDEAARHQVETIYGEAERASKIVSNLLTFARRRRAHKEPANLNTLIERVLELRNYDLRVRNINTDLDLDPALPETMVDANQMQQVFLNVLINAEQAMRGENDAQAEGRLRIQTRARGEAIVASFRDSGPGMSAETQRRIFDPFFTTKEAGDGTGLGLTISYGIIEDHGGRIWVESAPGRGTTFFIELPVVAGAPAAARGPEPEHAPSTADRRRILVVDDENSIQKLLMGVLEMDGHDVIIATNGREALDRLRDERFDLIISDIKMPVMGGPEMFGHLRDAGSDLARRVIFITGDTVSPDTRQFLQGVDNPVLSKPFRLRDVREAVRIALSR